MGRYCGRIYSQRNTHPCVQLYEKHLWLSLRSKPVKHVPERLPGAEFKTSAKAAHRGLEAAVDVPLGCLKGSMEVSV